MGVIPIARSPRSLPSQRLCVRRHDLVRRLGGDRQEAVVAAAGEGDRDGGLDTHLMPRRDEERGVAGSGADGGTDDLAAIDKRGVRAELVGRLLIAADQHRFGAADRRVVEHDAEVRGDAEAARVGVAVAVDEAKVDCRHRVDEVDAPTELALDRPRLVQGNAPGVGWWMRISRCRSPRRSPRGGGGQRPPPTRPRG